jgi:hypothetical protein
MIQVLEEQDLDGAMHKYLGRLALWGGAALLVLFFTAGRVYSSFDARVTEAERHIEEIDRTGGNYGRELDNRLQRIEWLLQTLPDSTARRVLEWRR